MLIRPVLHPFSHRMAALESPLGHGPVIIAPYRVLPVMPDPGCFHYLFFIQLDSKTGAARNINESVMESEYIRVHKIIQQVRPF